MVVALCLPLAVALLFFYLKRRRFLPLLFLISLACAYGLSAFITAAFAVPHNRFGSRLIWLLPFFCLAAVLNVIKHLKNYRE
jgi:4-hydroxybenzoate polyprenyltransferase